MMGMSVKASGLAASPTRLAALEMKRADLRVSRASEAGTFEGYASLFGVVDTGRDLVAPGAFAASLGQRGAGGVKMLWQHQAAEPIGVWTQINEDGRGLKVKGRLDLSVARAREALSLLRQGAVDGLSIGFRTKRAVTDRQSGIRKLLEIDLWEISIVTFPMLPQARVDSVKRTCRIQGPPRERRPALDAVRTKLARLRAHTAAISFEAKLLRFSRSLETRYDPKQLRVSAGSPKDGQWTRAGKDRFTLTDKMARDSQFDFDDVDSDLEQEFFVSDVSEPIAQSLAFCRHIKDVCIAECSDASLPTRDDGFTFFNCLNACLERHGCLGRV